MIKIFIGWDEKEPIAYHVLEHSILKRSSAPISITPLNRENLKAQFWRPRGEYDSTDFSNSRWIVPHLCGFEGWAIFMDCDMLCLGDIEELWAQRDDRYAVMVRKHVHIPKNETKFLGQQQTKYMRKNWSSLMMLNCSKLPMLTKHIVNTMHNGLWFHQFNFIEDNLIGDIDAGWNTLVGVNEPSALDKLVHYTDGGPWHGYNDIPYAKEWWSEYNSLVQGDNPIPYLTEKPDEISEHKSHSKSR